MRDVAVGLQVRLDSSRLPRKALLPLEGKLVIEHAMDALAATGIEHRYILTDEESAPVLAPLGERYGFSLLVGDPQDVLGRYARMAEVTGAPVVVRATGDNPAVSA
ncbi:MAG: cytidylyltransferase domain-containing protein, partial [Alkalispirochaetaceae bacterium]